MNSSPFEIFRRNLKPLMVLLTGLALFAFVVLPVVDSYMRQNSGSGGNAVIAKYGGKELTQNRVDYFTRNHHETVGFLAKLANSTIERGGIPKTAGFQYDPRTKQVMRLGINQNPGTEVSVRTMMFAAEAVKAGFVLEDNEIQIWLERFTDGTLSDSDITGMLMNATQNRMGRPHLYEQLRSHLLADVYLKRGYAGLYTGDNPSLGALMTPSEQWEAFLKLNRSATVDAYGVLVNDFIDQTNETPPEELIVATYEDGKNRDPSDQSPEPAFHQRYTASFEYLVGDLKTFIDEEVAKLKEEDIRAEYDKRLAGGAFLLPDEDSNEVLEEPEGGTADPDEGKSEQEKSDEPVKTEEPAEEADGDSEENAAEQKEAGDDSEKMPEDPVTEEPAKAKEEADSPSEAKPDPDSEAKPDPDSEAKPDPDSEAKPEPDSEAKPEAEAPSEDEQGSVDRSRSVRLVAFQEQADTESDEKESDAGETEAADKDEPTESGKADEAAEPADEGESDEGGEPAESKDGEAEESDESKADEEPEEAKKSKVQSFEDVREQIANDMAFPAARQRMVQSSAKVFSQMQSYFNKKAIYDGQHGDEPEPEKPDLEPIAQEFGFEYKAIGPYDRVSIADEPISTSMDAATQFGGQGPNFALMMYGYALGQNTVDPRALYTPLETTEFMSGKTYISWKVAETDERTPTLAEARDDVVNYLRMKEAKELAQSEAEELAKKAAEQSDKSLVDLIPEDKKENFKEGLGPFNWMNSFGQGVTMGNVPELDAVGEDFMAAVFEGEVGEYRIASNQPQRVIYIVKPTKFEPSRDELLQRFREPNNRRNIAAIDPGIGNVLGDFYESIDKKAGFTDYTLTEQ